MTNKNLVLTGFMGTGKSSIGTAVASKLGLKHVDIDTVIEQRLSMPISDIFSRFGEEYFRKFESQMISEFAAKSNQVISTGGGVVLNPQNVKNLRSNGFVILLKANPDVIFRNISEDSTRPLLMCENPKLKIVELLEARKDYYKENDYEIDVSKLTVEQATQKVVEVFIQKSKN